MERHEVLAMMTALKLAVTRGQPYAEQGMEVYESRRRDRKFSSLRRQAKKLGYQLLEIGDNNKNTLAATSTA